MTGQTSNLHVDLATALTHLEQRLGRSLVITSGYRDPQHNHEVGGVENSEHTYDPAQAADVACSNGAECWQLVTTALSIGIKRIGIGNGFVHLGVSKDKPQDVIWNYYPKET